ncbi:MAG: phospho-N-acetylmuramoyl-pentapeptide-transferase [Lentisphaerae bacterium]|jgi:phospho-N-acetylmuramoyl-pentapeptide-transferase|nr:phospho-N-acetylmuramoyl-pentapeptide-transferase [Lentisphaerota bacterium]
MLYYLSAKTDHFTWLNIFRYVTFRAFMGAGTAFGLSLLLGRWMIARLRDFNIGQVVRQEEEVDSMLQHHKRKAGTPTMGGLLILFATFVATALWCRTSNPQVWIAMGTMLFMGGVGFADDWLKLRKRHSGGLKEWQKLALQCGWVILMFLAIEAVPGTRVYARQLMVPFLKAPLAAHLPVWVAVAIMFGVLVGTTNAVNLTDGLDGLAAGCMGSVSAAYLALAYVAGHLTMATYLQVPSVSGAHELAVFCGCLLGAVLGFLWWNAYPAKVFMGDTGSLALGGAIAMVAILIKHELTLVIVGLVFVVEAGSVLIQRGACKLHRWRTGELLAQERRPFRMTPIHHHFELISKDRARAEGRSPEAAENTVVIRFWIVSIVCALLGLATLKVR